MVAWRKRVLLALGVVTTLLTTTLVAAAPAQAGPPPPTWQVESINTVGCASSATQFTMIADNVEGFTYRARTRVIAGGLVYMDEDAGALGSNGNYGWSLYDSSSAGPVDATFPLAEDTEVRVDFTLEDPIGTAFYSWTVIFDSCNEGNVLYNGPTSDIPVPTTTTTATTPSVAPTTAAAAAPVAAAAAPAVRAEPRFTG
jgi:hypothetical protein